jgi:chromosome segregation ATPase
MEWLWGALLKLIGMGGKGAKDAIEGYDRFTRRIISRLEIMEIKVDECDRERNELKSKIGEFEYRIKDCEEDRLELRSHITELQTKVNTLEAKTQ